MSTIPDPISSNPSTAASTPFKRRKSSVISVSTVPLIEDVNQPSVFILLPFALTSYTGERLVKQSEEHLVVSFSTQYTHPTPPTLGPETADKVTIRILHEGGPTIPQLPHGWILERAIDNSDLRSRVKRLGEAVERWKQSRKEGGPKRSATSECTLAVRYQAGWVDGVCIETLSGKQLSRVEFYHTELNVSSKKAKVTEAKRPPLPAPPSISLSSSDDDDDLPSIAPWKKKPIAQPVPVPTASTSAATYHYTSAHRRPPNPVGNLTRDIIQIQPAVQPVQAPTASTSASTSSSARPLPSTAVATLTREDINNMIADSRAQLHLELRQEFAAEIASLQRKNPPPPLPSAPRPPPVAVPFAPSTTAPTATLSPDQRMANIESRFLTVEKAAQNRDSTITYLDTRSQHQLQQLDKTLEGVRVQLMDLTKVARKEWASIKVNTVAGVTRDQALARDTAALALYIEEGANALRGSNNMALERHQMVDARLVEAEKRIIKQGDRYDRLSSHVDRSSTTEDIRVLAANQQKIAATISTLSSDVAAVRSQAAAGATSKSSHRLERDSEANRLIADHVARIVEDLGKIVEENAKQSSTIHTLRSEHDFFTAQHERDSTRSKAERARISDEIAMHAGMLSRFRDVTTREAASKAKNILSLSTTIHEVVPRVRAMEVHLREEAAGRTVGRLPWTPAPRIPRLPILPATAEATTGSTSTTPEIAASSGVEIQPEASTSANNGGSA